jgi:hypothetical protein
MNLLKKIAVLTAISGTLMNSLAFTYALPNYREILTFGDGFVYFLSEDEAARIRESGLEIETSLVFRLIETMVEEDCSEDTIIRCFESGRPYSVRKNSEYVSQKQLIDILANS